MGTGEESRLRARHRSRASNRFSVNTECNGEPIGWLVRTIASPFDVEGQFWGSVLSHQFTFFPLGKKLRIYQCPLTFKTG